MKPEDIFFSVNRYDSDGDVVEAGIFIDFGETSIRVAYNPQEFKLVSDRISSMYDEIKTKYDGEDWV